MGSLNYVIGEFSRDIYLLSTVLKRRKIKKKRPGMVILTKITLAARNLLGTSVLCPLTMHSLVLSQALVPFESKNDFVCKNRLGRFRSHANADRFSYFSREFAFLNISEIVLFTFLFTFCRLVACLSASNDRPARRRKRYDTSSFLNKCCD